MLGFLRAIEVLQRQKNDVIKQMKKVSAEERKSLQMLLEDLDETINHLHLKVNEFLIYIRSTDRKLYRVIKKHYFENISWDSSVDDIDVDADAYRKSISRACKKFDSMSDSDKQTYIK